MKFKSLSWIFVFLISISFISALAIISPTPNQSISTFLNVSFTDSSSNITIPDYRVYVNSNLINSSMYYFSTLEDATSIAVSSVTYTQVIFKAINTRLINVSMTIRATTGNDGTYLVQFKYADNTEVNQTYDIFGAESLVLTLNNTKYWTNVTNVTIYMKTISGDTINLNNDGGADPTLFRTITNTYNISNFPLNSLSLPLGIHNLSVQGYNATLLYSSNTTFNLTTNAVLNVTALNFFGGSISNFNLSVKDSTTNLTNNYSTTTGSISPNVVYGRNYTLNITPINYTIGSTNITIDSYSDNYSFTLYPDASLVLTLYDELTGFIINQSVNITVTDITHPYIVLGTTSNSTALIQNLPTDDVLELKFVSANYTSSRTYQIVLPGTYNYLAVYLLPNTGYQNITFTLYDSSGAIVEGAYMQELLLTNTSYVLAMSAYSDIAGKIYFSYNPNKYYKYTINDSRYVYSEFILNPPRDDNYDITLIPIGQTINYDYLSINGTSSYDNVSKMLMFNYTSSEVGMTYDVWVYNNGNKIYSSTSLLASNSFSYNLSNYEDKVYIYGVANDRIFYSSEIDIGKAKISDYISITESSFFSGIIFLLISLVGASMGVVISVILGIIALMIIAWLGIFSAVSLSILAVCIIIGIIIGVVVRRAR